MTDSKTIEATKLMTIPKNKRLQALLHNWMTDCLHLHSKKIIFLHISNLTVKPIFFIQSFKILYQLLPCTVIILNNSLLKIKKANSVIAKHAKRLFIIL